MIRFTLDTAFKVTYVSNGSNIFYGIPAGTHIISRTIGKHRRPLNFLCNGDPVVIDFDSIREALRPDSHKAA